MIDGHGLLLLILNLNDQSEKLILHHMPSCDGFRNGKHSEWSSAAMNSATMSTENPFESTPAKFVQNSTQQNRNYFLLTNPKRKTKSIPKRVRNSPRSFAAWAEFFQFQDTDPTRDLAFDLAFSRQFMALSERGRDWALWAVMVYHCV
ncbi:unnamed protein product [Malus baccata var. baccata]